LRRKIRIMENDKKAYNEESQSMLKRQANFIDKLKEENRTFCKQMIQNSKDQKKMSEVKKNMADAQGEIRTIKEKIEKEILLQKQLEEQMKQLQKEIIEKKRSTQGVSAASSQ
jgi:small-conductance mechanosensitive channel